MLYFFFMSVHHMRKQLYSPLTGVFHVIIHTYAPLLISLLLARFGNIDEGSLGAGYRYRPNSNTEFTAQANRAVNNLGM